MKKQVYYLSAMLVFVLLFNACGKYEDGPAFSLLSKKARISGTWKIDKMFTNDVEQTLSDDAKNGSMLVEKDGTGKMMFTMGTMTVTIDFEWEFGDGKETIKMRTKNLSGTWEDWDESKILRLTNKEFWAEDTEAGSTDVYKTYFIKE